MTLRRSAPVETWLIDTSYTLPPDARPITAARDASVAVPADVGDSVVVRRRVRL